LSLVISIKFRSWIKLLIGLLLKSSNWKTLTDWINLYFWIDRFVHSVGNWINKEIISDTLEEIYHALNTIKIQLNTTLCSFVLLKHFQCNLLCYLIMLSLVISIKFRSWIKLLIGLLLKSSNWKTLTNWINLYFWIETKCTKLKKWAVMYMCILGVSMLTLFLRRHNVKKFWISYQCNYAIYKVITKVKYICFIMKRKFKQWWSSTLPISMNGLNF
jgi:hypothetical protein